VWDLVGNSLEIQAVLKPASARPKAALRPAPPAPTTRASYSWSMTGYLLLRKGDASFARRGWLVMIRAVGTLREKARACCLLRPWENCKYAVSYFPFESTSWRAERTLDDEAANCRTPNELIFATVCECLCKEADFFKTATGQTRG
jgi:hypothetical protein